MRNRISARELYDQLNERLGLRWMNAGQRGGERTLERAEQQTRRPSLAGYLNVIHPNKVQIIELLNLLQYHMALALAPRISMHGVFMEIFSIGVLITGDSGAGKSELALELISRGHRLVADDAPEFTQIAPDVLDGTCPEMLQDMLEVRGLGVMNIRQMFGDTSVKRNKYLRLIVHLVRPVDANQEAMARLTGEAPAPIRMLDLDIPVFQLPVAAGRNLAVLTEAAVRLHMLRVKGLDPAAAFLARHASLLSLGQES